MNDLIKALEDEIGKQKVSSRLLDRLAFASDAGFYRFVPKAIVRPHTEEDVQKILRVSVKYNVPVTFRAGGTSLSGQSVTDGILVDISKNWKKVTPNPLGNTVKVQPGVTGGIVNQILLRKSQKIGPDPSSINAAMMGGILANNSSGMCCGVQHNSYHTLKSIRFILQNGNIFDTSQSSDYVRFEEEEKELSNGLKEIRSHLLKNEALVQKIKSKYKIKNTVGYCVNSLLDFEHPLDIMSHLLIGSEGTLGFISEAELITLKEKPFKATAFILFEKIEDACNAIQPLTDAGAEALELMDRSSLRTIENLKGVPQSIRALSDSGAALLCELQSDTLDDFHSKLQKAKEVISQLNSAAPSNFTTDPDLQYFYWKLRKGMFPAVGAIRKQGTTVVLEDIAFPVASLAAAITDLQILFKKFNYQEAIIFGHAKDGNIHFVITQDFSSPDEIQRYDEFINEVVDLTIHKYNGSLKAEHGTGRNMAPFVETEWGPEIYAIMKRIKSLADPKDLFNPGVIINDDPKAHLKNIKPMPSVATEVDKCIECGYCEPNCPSRNLTITPRQRIQLRREMVQMDKKSKEFELLLKDYQYSGLDTCAVDGMCANDCPVDINTGELVKRLRRENHSPFSNKVGVWVAVNFNLVEKSIRLSLRTGVLTNSLLGKNAMVGLTKQIRKVAPEFPLWINGTALPKKITNIPTVIDAIYFQTCISRLMGGYENQLSLPEALIQVSESLGVRLLLSPKVEGMCCSQPFASKGFESANQKMANSTIASLYELSNKGRLPIVVDTSSCTHTLQNLTHSLSEENKEKYKKLTFLDSVDYVHDMLLPKITNIQRIPKVALHPVCSLYKSGIVKKMKAIAEQLADNVEVPLYSGCCGMAGDRGFHFPELTHSAATPSSQYLSDTCNGYYSSSRTCELSMSKETGRNYESIVFLLLEALGK